MNKAIFLLHAIFIYIQNWNFETRLSRFDFLPFDLIVALHKGLEWNYILEVQTAGSKRAQRERDQINWRNKSKKELWILRVADHI